MNTLMSELHRDHIHYFRHLQALENQLNLLQRSEAVELYVLSDMVAYLQSYPDPHHHAREDLILSVYLERSERGVNLIKRLMSEHRLLVEQGADLLSQFEQWACDSPVSRERIASSLDHYLRTHWLHLTLEEDSVYALVSSELTTGDWERIGAAVAKPCLDPLYSPLAAPRETLGAHF